jgi:hypothetical protein
MKGLSKKMLEKYPKDKEATLNGITQVCFGMICVSK